MTSEQAELWQRIDEFSIDGPEPVAFAFAARLARENGWSRAFSERAVVEYKRFVFLALTAGHPVCPSEQVDQVRHLHLTYLFIFVAVAGAAFAVAFLLRRKMRQPADVIDIGDDAFDCYDLALLAGGPRRVFDTAMIKLIDDGKIEWTADGRLRLCRQYVNENDSVENDVLERMLVHGDMPATALEVRKNCKLNVDANKERLQEHGLLLSDGDATRASFFPGTIDRLAVRRT